MLQLNKNHKIETYLNKMLGRGKVIPKIEVVMDFGAANKN